MRSIALIFRMKKKMLLNNLCLSFRSVRGLIATADECEQLQHFVPLHILSNCCNGWHGRVHQKVTDCFPVLDALAVTFCKHYNAAFAGLQQMSDVVDFWKDPGSFCIIHQRQRYCKVLSSLFLAPFSQCFCACPEILRCLRHLGCSHLIQ